MTARSPRPVAVNNDSKFATWIAVSALLVTGAFVGGGFWMQSQQQQEAQQRQQAEAYRTYLNNTPPTQLLPSKPPADTTQAHETRQYLLTHPAVTPGEAFDKPGVQATGKTIVQAIDQAKGL